MRLVVEVPAIGSEWRFVQLSDALQVLQHGRCTPDLLPQATQVIAVLHPAQVSWHALAMPKQQTGNRLRAVLDGLMEDLVLEDTASLYFACAKASLSAGPGKRWVLACQRAWLTSQLARLEQAERKPQSVVAWMPPHSGEPQMWWHGDGSHAQVTIQSADGVWTTTPDALSEQSKALMIRAEPACISSAEAWAERKVAPLSWHEHLAQCALPQHDTAGNLAQFELAHLGNQSVVQRAVAGLLSMVFAPQWRALRLGLTGLVLVNLIGLQVAAFQHRKALEAKREAVNTVLQQTFPEAKVIVDAPAQMAKLVNAAWLRSGQLTATDFEVLLSAWALASSGSPQQAPASLEYRDGEMKVTPGKSGAAQ